MPEIYVGSRRSGDPAAPKIETRLPGAATASSLASAAFRTVSSGNSMWEASTTMALVAAPSRGASGHHREAELCQEIPRLRFQTGAAVYNMEAVLFQQFKDHVG
jgi:hypothetical protein